MKPIKPHLGVLFTAASLLYGCGIQTSQLSSHFEVIDRFPHDSNAYTQGLLLRDSVLYESTGKYGHSEVRIVDLKTGQVLKRRKLPPDRFGEGLTLYNKKLFQLTWQSGVAYIYDPTGLELLDSIKYPGEGWGLTNDDDLLIMSDGSDSLRFISPLTFEIQKVIRVKYNGSPMYQINELEYLNGEILANVYGTNWVMRIDPETGIVKEAIDFSEMYRNRPGSADVMNGIAKSHNGEHLLLTGKNWPLLFKIRLKQESRRH